MHYYTRNLGDYAKKAGRLSMLQHGAYTLLLDACYDRERFPTESEAIEWTWASTPDEEQAVRFVLSRFFEKQGDGVYVQSRVKEELVMFKIGGIQNRLIAISREAKKQKRDELAKACDQLRDEIKHAPLSKTHDAWTSVIDALVKSHEAPPNQEPITNNQEPRTSIKPSKPPAGVSDRKFSNEDLRCAEFVFTGIQRIAPRTKPPNIEKWADQVRLMRESDKLTHREICEVFVWANQDPFWSTNILSISKLREKFAALSAKRESENAKHSGNPKSGLHPATGQAKLSTVGRNHLKGEQYLERIRREADAAPGDYGPVVATTG